MSMTFGTASFSSLLKRGRGRELRVSALSSNSPYSNRNLLAKFGSAYMAVGMLMESSRTQRKLSSSCGELSANKYLKVTYFSLLDRWKITSHRSIRNKALLRTLGLGTGTAPRIMSLASSLPSSPKKQSNTLCKATLQLHARADK